MHEKNLGLFTLKSCAFNQVERPILPEPYRDVLKMILSCQNRIPQIRSKRLRLSKSFLSLPKKMEFQHFPLCIYDPISCQLFIHYVFHQGFTFLSDQSFQKATINTIAHLRALIALNSLGMLPWLLEHNVLRLPKENLIWLWPTSYNGPSKLASLSLISTLV